MLKVNEIQKRFNHIEHTISQAAQACQFDSTTPRELRDCVTRLEQQAGQAKQVLQSQDENRIRQCVDDLEQISDRAKQSMQPASGVADEVKNAVMQAHRELSELKRQLH